MIRPKCEWKNGADCDRPATWIVMFMDNYREHLSCGEHKDKWDKARRGVFLAELKGYDDQATIEEIFEGNRKVGQS